MSTIGRHTSQTGTLFLFCWHPGQTAAVPNCTRIRNHSKRVNGNCVRLFLLDKRSVRVLSTWNSSRHRSLAGMALGSKIDHENMWRMQKRCTKHVMHTHAHTYTQRVALLRYKAEQMVKHNNKTLGRQFLTIVLILVHTENSSSMGLVTERSCIVCCSNSQFDLYGFSQSSNLPVLSELHNFVRISVTLTVPRDNTARQIHTKTWRFAAIELYHYDFLAHSFPACFFFFPLCFCFAISFLQEKTDSSVLLLPVCYSLNLLTFRYDNY